MPHSGTHAIHHLHKRKRVIEAISEVEGLDKAEVKEAVLKPVNRFKRVLDKLVYFAGITAVIMCIPQGLHIWVNQNASGLSLITWATFLVNAVIWSAYGIIHKETPIIIMYISYIFIDLFIVSGILMYG
ncbi:hypothetical protein ACFL10_00485 [Patescibacteria group bacterium]